MYDVNKLWNSPSPDRDHLGVGGHEQLRCVAEALVPLDTDPGILSALRIEREQERFAGAKVRLPLATVVLEVTLEPPR